MISYEYPLNERIRTLLRLEDLYDKFRHFSALTGSLEHHVAILSLFEILEAASRGDLKSDLLQELERQKAVLEALRNNPDVAEDALHDLLSDVDRTLGGLRGMPGKVGQHLRENDWLMSIKQRTGIPGGVCEFDLPTYHFWLHQDQMLRRQELSEWIAPMLPIYEGLGIVLRVLRESGRVSHLLARSGVYQQMLAGRLAQMLRISLDHTLPCIPEISANKYMINVRFTTLEGTQRHRVCDRDVAFDLFFCNL